MQPIPTVEMITARSQSASSAAAPLVIVVEDDPALRNSLKFSLEIEGYAVHLYPGGRELLDDGELPQHGCLVIDYKMPDMNGLKATERLCAESPGVRVVALTRHTDRGYMQQLLQAGASGYVLKQSDPAVLLQAVRAVAAGGNYLDPAITGKALSGFFGRRGGSAREVYLSERETEVLRLIALGYSNKEIAARLSLSVKTVEAHKANAMRKLDMTSRIDIVRYAMLQGWLQDT